MANMFLMVALGIGWVPTATAQERPTASGEMERPAGIAASRADLLSMTPLWKGERYPDGRPKVAEDLLRRMKDVSIEEAWDVLRKRGYESQFARAGRWSIPIGRSSDGR